MKNRINAALLLTLALTISVHAFELSSHDIKDGQFMSKQQEFKGFGCDGDNLSPHLRWQDAPKQTKSFAITAYDPDAPTGSGWWHWQVVDIPSTVESLGSGVGTAKNTGLPEGAKQIKNDYGNASFGGACPPKGHGVHRYQFTIHALGVAKLPLPDAPSSALVGYMINANSLASKTIEALYKKD
ncbi:hypothetical protein PSECIP111951_02562 [Pseudoalteromonas holothuriae]|uniref:Kinase inhibitor n=1 Tax=Pseudoalteromonas holothuriae TaxID=2963714 RepID=A0ABM9GJM4_9GAMM|nr:YbhB/YbcL family Raf kinase inhibitor-like protein [Pseudoalteromonas sp. CIP111951]CAH9061793.1 hypothetical protein PSECIP111951_02562 [Pseudoalteromonas sp. CIP111951]